MGDIGNHDVQADLLTILAAELDAMGRLHAELQDEADALEHLYADRLPILAERKQSLVDVLEALTVQRTECLRRAGIGTEPAGMRAYFGTAPARVVKAWEDLIAETALCEQLNRHNRALNQNGQRQILRVLRVLRGEPVEPPTYGRDSGMGIGGQPLAKV